MERALTSEEKIRRAEEIYNRRRMQNGVRVSTSKVNTSTNDKYILYKKLILQIAICFIIYFILYLIKNSNYIFSEEFMKKTKEFLYSDINFQNIYDSGIEFYNKNLKNFFVGNPKENLDENNTNVLNEEITNTVVDVGIGGGEDKNIIANNEIEENQSEEVSNEPELELSQMEIDAASIQQEHNLILPLVGVISSRYGPREGNEIVSSNHAGIDIAANTGTVFVAAMSGTVIVASHEGSYGKHIFIQEGDVITVYAHCSELYVEEGDVINQGQELGEVGATGNATGPHLHFEIRKDNRTVNPELILDFV